MHSFPTPRRCIKCAKRGGCFLESQREIKLQTPISKLSEKVSIPSNFNLQSSINGDRTKVEYIAKWMMEELDAKPESEGLYYKAAYKIPLGVLNRLLGLSKDPQVRNRGAYFNKLVQKEFQRNI